MNTTFEIHPAQHLAPKTSAGGQSKIYETGVLLMNAMTRIRHMFGRAALRAEDRSADQQRRAGRSAADHPAYQNGLDLGRMTWG